ncbi:MAG: MucR family transcriptional regulator [Mesorhizobium sp.]|nr:MucR family transcriptional regulator [Mesorhizobium sp.]MCO5161139.1 MucR family transcriptional regulator [Mesorhizobium sp.]
MTDQVAKNNETVSVSLTCDIVAAYVANNSVPRSNLTALIADVHAALDRLRSSKPGEGEKKLVPSVPIKKSVSDDYIVCLEDGKKFKSLKRHLITRYGLTPDEYRARWDLPANYPMVAPAFAAARSALARSMGLGRKPAEQTVASESVSTRGKRKVVPG